MSDSKPAWWPVPLPVHGSPLRKKGGLSHASIQRMRSSRSDTGRALTGDLPGIVANICNRKISVRNAFQLKGGWEGWLQVEFALATEERFAVVREEHVYDAARDRADAFQQKGNLDTVVEIKCESVGQRGAFASGVLKDVTKLQSLKDPGRAYCVMVVVATHATVKELINSLGEIDSDKYRGHPYVVLEDEDFALLVLDGV